MSGLETRCVFRGGHAHLDQIMSVASFFVSRVDTKVDAALKLRLVEAAAIHERQLLEACWGRSASPKTCTIPPPCTMRFEPTILATGMTEVTCTTGIPAFSSSVVIAAPLRVLVPHVEVSMTASIPSSFTRSAISRPIRRVFESGLANPEVEIKLS